MASINAKYLAGKPVCAASRNPFSFLALRIDPLWFLASNIDPMWLHSFSFIAGWISAGCLGGECFDGDWFGQARFGTLCSGMLHPAQALPPGAAWFEG
jgi:hypothetical protein